MNQNYYPIDFEAQYQETSQKMLEITNKFKDKIRTIKPATQQELEEQVEELQVQIDDHELQFRKQSIYSQFASGQLMAEKRKQPPEMCPECGEELKKQVQCQFCAEIFCNKCCCRKRVIPFVSKDIRLCCEQCHWKYVKLFDNKNFYEEKEKLANVINFVKNKVNKISEKVAAKSQEVEEIRKVKRDEKIKEKALDNKIIQEEKKLRQIEEQLRRVVAEKVQRMQEEERRRQREEEEREKARRAEEERERAEKEEKLREEQRIRKAKELQQQLNLSASQKKIHPQKIEIEGKERELLEAFKRKQEELKRREEQLLRKQEEIKRQTESSNEIKSVRSSTSLNKAKTPKQSIGKNSSEKEKIIDTADSKSASRSRRGSDDEARKLLQSRPENLVKTESTKSTIEQPSAKKYTIKEEKESKIEEEPIDALERSLVNMFKPKKDDDTKSVQSNTSKISKSILDMSVNELLTVRIPVTRVSSKIEIEEKPAQAQAQLDMPIVEEEVPATPTRRTLDHRQSLKVQQVQEVNKQEVRMHKDSILRNSSLITSGSKATTVQEEVTPAKCACEIM